MERKQVLNLGSNEKRKWIRDNVSEDTIKSVNPKGYAYLKVAESERLINAHFSGSTPEPTEPKQEDAEPKKAPAKADKPLIKKENQMDKISALLAEMMQNQGAQLDEDAVRELVASEVAKHTQGVKRIKIDFKTKDIDTDVVTSTRPNFENMLIDLNVGNNVLLSGPTGSGKTVLASELALASGCKTDNIYTVSCEPFTFKGDFWGAYKSATEYVEGAFEKASKDVADGLQACVILDELTKLDPEIAGTLNAPLSHTKDRKQYFTNGKGEKFEITDVLIIATTNTWGKGFDARYVGNSQQDLSLLNRFASSKYYVDYDRELERSIVHQDVFQRLDKLRTKMLNHEIQHSITLRDMVNIDLARQAGKPLETSVECLVADWSEDERAKVGL